MDPEDLFVGAIGVLLTQVRTARRALEEVERSTTRYLGFEFARALAEGPAFGAPPMVQGALKVHVVNINDLAPGNSFGGFLEALLGGVGSFLGNLIGGIPGSFLASWGLPRMVERLERIVADVRAILERLGVGAAAGATSEQAAAHGAAATRTASTAEAQAGTGTSLLTTLEGIRGTVRDVTALFQAAASGPGGAGGAEAAAETSQTVLSPAGERWMAVLHGVNRALDRTAHLVDGLVLLIPNLVGAVALLVANLGAIRQALLETVQFVLRNALILRGVLLTVIYETVASAARLAAAVVGTLATAIQGILTSVLGVVQALLAAAFDAIEEVTMAVQAIARALLGWLVTGVFDTLAAIGELQVFRTIDHLVRILPALLPPIFMLLNEGRALPEGVMERLIEAHAAAFPPGGGAAGGGAATATEVTIGEFPDLSEILTPLEAQLSTAVEATAATVAAGAEKTFGTAEGALGSLAGSFQREVRREAEFSRGILATHVERIQGEAATLADTITAPLEAAGPATGLEEIADAYQDWLVGGGLETLVGGIEQHFASRPAEGEPGGPLGLLRGQFDQPRASIEIERVEIVIEGEPEGAAPDRPVGDFNLPREHYAMSDEEVYRAVARYAAEREERGITAFDPGAALA